MPMLRQLLQRRGRVLRSSSKVIDYYKEKTKISFLKPYRYIDSKKKLAQKEDKEERQILLALGVDFPLYPFYFSEEKKKIGRKGHFKKNQFEPEMLWKSTEQQNQLCLFFLFFEQYLCLYFQFYQFMTQLLLCAVRLILRRFYKYQKPQSNGYDFLLRVNTHHRIFLLLSLSSWPNTPAIPTFSLGPHKGNLLKSVVNYLKPKELRSSYVVNLVVSSRV